MSHPITSERFCDMHIYAPVGMQEQLWLWLYNEGLVDPPLQWIFDLMQRNWDWLKYRIGLAFLPVFESAVRAFSDLV